jgi:hypothetical protein
MSLLTSGLTLVALVLSSAAETQLEDPLDVGELKRLDWAHHTGPLSGTPNPLLEPGTFGSSMVLAADGCVLFGVCAHPAPPLAEQSQQDDCE